MSRARVERLSRLAIAAGLAAHTVMFVWVIAGRLTFPFELEWMTGSVLDHVERVRQGLPVYTEPSARWVPFLYPPLYYWICAPLGGTVLVCRLVSLACSLTQLGLAYVVARRLGATKFWSVVASGLFLACFSYVGWWYDLERTDSLYAMLAVLGAVLVLRARGPLGYALAGVVLGVGFLAKQQIVFYAAGAGAGLLLASRFAKKDDRPRLADVVAFGAAVGGAIGGGIAYAAQREGGVWFKYYILDMPRAHGILWHLAPTALGRDFGLGFAFVGVTCALGWLVLERLRAFTLTRSEIVFTAMLGAGFAAAVASRLHIGGWINVLQPWTAFAAIATAVLASRLEAGSDHPRLRPAIAAVLFVQMALWAYEPGSYCPPRKSRAMHEAFAARVHDLEKKGEVLIVARGHITTPRHAHISALADAIRVDGHAPKDLIEGLEKNAYVAIIDAAREDGDPPVDDDWPPVRLEDFPDVNGPLLSHYYVAQRLFDDEVSLALRSPVRPIWLYLPRTKPIAGTPAQLRKHQLAEMRLTTVLATARLQGRKLWFDDSQVESLAEADVASGH